MQPFVLSSTFEGPDLRLTMAIATGDTRSRLEKTEYRKRLQTRTLTVRRGLHISRGDPPSRKTNYPTVSQSPKQNLHEIDHGCYLITHEVDPFTVQACHILSCKSAKIEQFRKMWQLEELNADSIQFRFAEG